jgi:Na+/melibiose symporter-like transporter
MSCTKMSFRWRLSPFGASYAEPAAQRRAVAGGARSGGSNCVERLASPCFLIFSAMNPRRLQTLRISLLVLGSVCIALGPLMLLWPAGWRWEPHHARYEQMMVGIYFTLGVFLLFAAREPLRHLSLIWFTVASSVVHGSIMAVQALSDSRSHGHLLADVPALFIAAAVLGTLTPRRAASERPVAAG